MLTGRILCPDARRCGTRPRALRDARDSDNPRAFSGVRAADKRGLIGPHLSRPPAVFDVPARLRPVHGSHADHAARRKQKLPTSAELQSVCESSFFVSSWLTHATKTIRSLVRIFAAAGVLQKILKLWKGEKYEKRKLIEQRSKKVPCGTLWLLFSAQHAQI